MRSKRHPDWDRIFWGGRVRPEFRRRVIDIASSVATAKSSYHGNMLHSSETRVYEFLDGCVWWKMGGFSASSGVRISGQKCLQYVLYELAFDPRKLLPDTAIIYKRQELKAEIKAAAPARKLLST
jgi:hypothetical protein